MKGENAYLTVEAALVMPMVLGVVVLTVYLLFFQYDRCLMEQNIGVLVMRGCTIQVEKREMLAEELRCQMEKIDTGKYLAWNVGEVKMALHGSYVTAEQTGWLSFPFRGLSFWNGGDTWEASVKYKNNRIAPMSFVRNCRKIMGGK